VFINLGFLFTSRKDELRLSSIFTKRPDKMLQRIRNGDTLFGTGRDGELQAGVEWPEPRFTVSGGEMAPTTSPGLMWAQNGNLPNGPGRGRALLDFIASLNGGTRLCGYHDWRLPNANELESLANAGEANSATWLIGQGFGNVQASFYWSSTTYAYSTGNAWIVNMWYGSVLYDSEPSEYYVWPVRSGQLNNADPLYSANVWKSGETTSYASGDDGDFERAFLPAPGLLIRVTGQSPTTSELDVVKNAISQMERKRGRSALDYVKAINGKAGLSGYHDWRLLTGKSFSA
jgi:hypothetical protein